jgi:invasion protein IalB
MRSGLVAALTVPLLLSPAHPAKAEAKKPSEKAFQDWTLVCQKPEGADKELCELRQGLVRKAKDEDGKEVDQPLMLAVVGYLPKESKPVVLFTLPLGLVLLPPGLSLQVDEGEAVRFPVQACTRGGCQGALPLSDTLVNGFKSGKEGKLSFQDLAGKPVTFPVSLKGFTAGFKALGESRK